MTKPTVEEVVKAYKSHKEGAAESHGIKLTYTPTEEDKAVAALVVQYGESTLRHAAAMAGAYARQQLKKKPKALPPVTPEAPQTA